MVISEKKILPVQKCISGETVRNLSDTELLSVIIGSGSGANSVFDIASSLYYRFGGLRGLYSAGIGALAGTKGVGKVKAIKIASSLELGRRIVGSPVMEVSLNSPEFVWKAVLNDITGLENEIFIVLVLNTQNKIIRKKVISVGTVSETVVHPREIFREAIREGGSSLIVCHNHPSGDTTPSTQDVDITDRLCHAGKILGIPLLDHLVVTEQGYHSMKESGEMTI